MGDAMEVDYDKLAQAILRQQQLSAFSSSSTQNITGTFGTLKNVISSLCLFISFCEWFEPRSHIIGR